eukprot:753379-Hanusia_phi.AAC.2
MASTETSGGPLTDISLQLSGYVMVRPAILNNASLSEFACQQLPSNVIWKTTVPYLYRLPLTFRYLCNHNSRVIAGGQGSVFQHTETHDLGGGGEEEVRRR